MFYFIFQQIYLKMKKDIERENSVRAEQEILPSGIVKETYEYLEDKHPQHFCNIYKVSDTNDSKNFPLIIDIHGGGWICGDKDTNDNFDYHLALQKNNVTSLSYRTVDQCTILEQIKDIFAYFHFLKCNGDKLGISFHKVVLTGDSAGAQLAMLSYCINQSETLQKLFGVKHVDISVSCLVLNHGVCYLNHAGRLAGKPFISKYISVPGLLEMIYGKKFKRNEIYLATVSPSAYIWESGQLPSVLLITSEGDKAYSYQTFELYKYFKKIGIACELYFEKNIDAGHVFNVAYPDSEMGATCNGYIDFFFRGIK